MRNASSKNDRKNPSFASTNVFAAFQNEKRLLKEKHRQEKQQQRQAKEDEERSRYLDNVPLLQPGQSWADVDDDDDDAFMLPIEKPVPKVETIPEESEEDDDEDDKDDDDDDEDEVGKESGDEHGVDDTAAKSSADLESHHRKHHHKHHDKDKSNKDKRSKHAHAKVVSSDDPTLLVDPAKSQPVKKDLSQLSKKERRMLRERELEDLDKLLQEFTVPGKKDTSEAAECENHVGAESSGAGEAVKNVKEESQGPAEAEQTGGSYVNGAVKP